MITPSLQQLLLFYFFKQRVTVGLYRPSNKRGLRTQGTGLGQ